MYRFEIVFLDVFAQFLAALSHKHLFIKLGHHAQKEIHMAGRQLEEWQRRTMSGAKIAPWSHQSTSADVEIDPAKRRMPVMTCGPS
jgi:hypothetical protein